MKRAGNLLPAIADPENIRVAFWKAAKGKRARGCTIAFAAHLEERVAKMSAQLLDGTFGFGNYRKFRIFDPKERTIHAAAFPERVAHHAIMNVVEPILERSAVFDSYACRKGKGRLDALTRAQCHARQYAWYLKMDVRKYFDSIPHRPLLDLLARKIKDPAVLGLFEKIVGSYETRRADSEAFGLPIGSLSSQHLANFYLGGLDRLALEALKTGGYVRYMDDFVLWHGDKDWLKAARDRIVHFMDTTLGLSAKPEPYINRSAHGMDFLGLRVFPHTLRLNARSKLRFLRKLRQLETAHETDEISSAALQQRATCLVDFTLHADSHGFRHSAGIWKEEGSRRPARTVCCVAGRGTTTRTTRVFPTATGTTRPTGTTTTDSALPKLSLAVVGGGGLPPPPCPGVTRWLSCPAVDAAGKENEPVRCQ